MSMSHHGNKPPEDSETMKRLLAQLEGRQQKREFPQGRMSADDDGTLALAVAADKKHNVIVIDFGKEVSWVGLGPKEVQWLVSSLASKARDLGMTITVEA